MTRADPPVSAAPMPCRLCGHNAHATLLCAPKGWYGKEFVCECAGTERRRAPAPAEEARGFPNIVKAQAETIAAQDAELEKLRSENFWDLIEQTREAWGEHWREVNREEFEAFVSSRRIHKPTTTIRAELAALREENARLAKALKPFARAAENGERFLLRTTPPEDIWLWKPSSNMREMAGINLAHILEARAVIAARKEKK